MWKIISFFFSIITFAFLSPSSLLHYSSPNLFLLFVFQYPSNGVLGVLQRDWNSLVHTQASGVPRNFFSGGAYTRNFFQQIQLRIEGRENGDLGAAAP
jgi:hypothetical protein